MHRISSRVAVALAIPCALFVLACGAGQAQSGGSGAAGGGKTTGDGGSTLAKIGQPVRDGKFEFTVAKVKCGVHAVGDSLLSDKAQGQFCLVTLKVRNIGSEAQTFDDSSQYAFGTTGAKYSADSTAGIDANNGTASFLDDINPGNVVTGIVVYDIPKTAHIAKLELHDSPFSGGVTVTVK